MEHVGAISEAEWNALNGMSSEEADFMAQLLGNCSLPNEVHTTYWPSHENMAVDETAMYSSDETNNASMYSFSQGSNGYSGHVGYYSNVPHEFFVPNDYFMMENKNNNNNSRIHILNTNAMEGDEFLNQDDVNNDSIESNENLPKDVLLAKKDDRLINESKKRSRIPDEVQKNTRNMKIKKCAKLEDNDEDNNNNNGMVHRQSSSSLCSEDESNASREMHGVASCSSSKASKALKSAGKARANRGSATDPQSLYARKRRERINERLRILQNLVPNGTKVDISTMLEEAVQYVKFLQLQIKLLSSDDMWMYAPLAYNGMDIGLDLKIATPKPQS